MKHNNIISRYPKDKKNSTDLIILFDESTRLWKMGAAQIKILYHYVIKQAIQGGNMKDGVKEFNNSKIRK